MREILFRGQTRRKGQKVWMDGTPVDSNWAEGYGVCVGNGPHSVIYSGHPVEKFCVYTDTIGQFTGLTDKNGTKIFEGDIIRSDNGKQCAVSVVEFGEYYPQMFYKMLDMFCPGKAMIPAVGFHAVSVGKGEEMILFQSPCVTVIGNIYDNPELLEVADSE